MHIITGIIISALLGKKKKDNPDNSQKKPMGFRNVLEVRHFIPGRIRLYAPIIRYADFGSIAVKEKLSSINGIVGVSSSTVSGTLLINFDPAVLTPDVVFAAAVHVLGIQDEIEEIPKSFVSSEIKNIGDSLNRALYEKSGGLLDFRTLIPITLAGLGVYKMLQPGGLSIPGGFTLLWWAFMRLNGEQSSRR